MPFLKILLVLPIANGQSAYVDLRGDRMGSAPSAIVRHVHPGWAARIGVDITPMLPMVFEENPTYTYPTGFRHAGVTSIHVGVLCGRPGRVRKNNRHAILPSCPIQFAMFAAILDPSVIHAEVNSTPLSS